MVHYVKVFSVLGSPKLDTALEMRSHKYQTEGKNHHFPPPAGYPPPDVAHSAGGLLCLKCTLMTRVQIIAHKDIRSFPAKLLPSQSVLPCAALWAYSIPDIGLCICLW